MVYGREADGVLSMRSILFLGCIVWFAVYLQCSSDIRKNHHPCGCSQFLSTS